MQELFNLYIYQPIVFVLVFIYQNFSFHDLGIAITLLTILIRIILFPLFYKSAHDQSLMATLQPKIKKIQTDLKNNKEAQAKELMALYRDHKLNPFSGIFLVLLQLPIFIALFQVFSKELSNGVFISTSFLGILDLHEKSIVLAIIAALLQYYQGKISLPKTQPQESTTQGNPLASMGKMMVYFAPGITLMVLTGLPAALGIYWSVSTLFSIGQQYYINAKLHKEITIPKEMVSPKGNDK